MFYTEFDSLLPEEKKGITFYPEKYAKQIDEVNTWVYDTVNNGYPSPNHYPFPCPLPSPSSSFHPKHPSPLQQVISSIYNLNPQYLNPSSPKSSVTSTNFPSY